MCGHKIKDRIRRERIGVALIAEKIIESCLRWFGYVQRRQLDAPVRMRRRSKKTLNKIIQ